MEGGEKGGVEGGVKGSVWFYHGTFINIFLSTNTNTFRSSRPLKKTTVIQTVSG